MFRWCKNTLVGLTAERYNSTCGDTGINFSNISIILWCLNCYFMYGKSLNFKTQASRSVLHYPCDLVWIPAGLVGCNNSCSHLNNLWQWKILYLLLAAGVIVATRRDFFQERRCYQNKFKKLKCYCFTLSECAIKMYKWI